MRVLRRGGCFKESYIRNVDSKQSEINETVVTVIFIVISAK